MNTTTTRVFEAIVSPASGGFEMWQVGEWSECEGCADIQSWVSVCQDNGVEVEHTDEIDGRVYEQDDAEIYKSEHDGRITYHAVLVEEEGEE